MELTVLGKYGPYAKKGGNATSCYLVEDKGASIVLDMGSGTLSRLQMYKEIKDIDAIFISHLHYDHVSDLLAFRYLLEELRVTITVYTAKNDSEWYKILLNHPLINTINIDEFSKINIKGINLSFYKMSHPVDNYAIKIKGTRTLVYTGDTIYNENILNAAEGADLLLADCSKPAGFNGPHMTVEEAVMLQEKIKIKILATHISPDYSPKEYFKNHPFIEVAEELTTYKI